MARLLTDGAHRGDPPLRRALARRGVDRRTGQVLPRQRRGRRRAARGGPGRRRRAGRVLVLGRGVRHARPDPDPRGRPAPTDQPVRRDEADVRGRPRLVRPGLRDARREPALLQRGGRDRGPRRGPRPGDPPHPQRPGRGRGPPDADRLRRRLPDARRHLHPRLHPRRGSRRRPPPGDRGDRAAATRGPTRSSRATSASAAGFSIREVIAAAERAVGAPIPFTVGPRREGDPPVLVAAVERATTVLGWHPAHPSLDEMVGSAWAWRRRHPDGYPD